MKQERIRQTSAYGSHLGWRLAPILIKANDDLRQEELASQLIYRMASILAREKVPVWLCPYEIIALTDRAGLIEAIPDTISIDSLKRNDPNFTNLRNFFMDHYGEGTEELSDAKANFVESLAAYSMVCFLLQLKDRHHGNILIDSRGHVIHIDFGFFSCPPRARMPALNRPRGIREVSQLPYQKVVLELRLLTGLTFDACYNSPKGRTRRPEKHD